MAIPVILTVILLVILYFMFGRKLIRNIGAIQSAKVYCSRNNLEYKEVKVFPNHYGLYFRKAAKSYYANYTFKNNEGIAWKNGSPIDKINA